MVCRGIVCQGDVFDMSDTKIYACIDLKSFFASVECVERGLDPLKTNLVVADKARGNGAICLAVSPALKALGVRNRCRIYEIPKDIEYITALPRMKLYIEYSANVYETYLKYISKDDIHVYSIDECFLDLTPYLNLYEKTAKELVLMLIKAVFDSTGITASAGYGTNMFLAKIALDITAKHTEDNIGYLDEKEFRRTIWRHRPITDIWNIGKGTAHRLEKYGVYDLYGVTKLPEKILYKEFGTNAEFLIDHANGYEPCTIKEIHEYTAKTASLSNSQIFFEDYNFKDAFVCVKEMIDLLSLELIDKNLVTDSISLTVNYSKNIHSSTGGTRKLSDYINCYTSLVKAFKELYEETTLKEYPIRQVSVSVNNITEEEFIQISLFEDNKLNEKERKAQEAIIKIKNKYGKNSVVRGISLEEKATGCQRNKMIGGHNGG